MNTTNIVHLTSTHMGVERGIRLEGLSEAQISKALEDLLKVGEALKKA
ncbi:hypothetical protein TIFTF001_020882 [Ficus carica]|uniref:Uncharacterized protein n=1 Tax=Ficus carica TaxID=3494 RepID=A0AA88DJP3_FICCA|nr:hypothetical protein TIFTF001_020882 [Ficus carica]